MLRLRILAPMALAALLAGETVMAALPLNAQTPATRPFERLRPDGNGHAAFRRPVVIEADAAALADVIRSIQRQAGLSLVFGDDLDGLDRRTTLRDTTMSAAEALIAVLSNTNLEVLVSPSGQAVIADRTARDQTRSVRGVVADEATGMAVADAEVWLEDVHRRVLSDRAGRFALDEIAVGAHTLLVRRAGYHEARLGIDVATDVDVAVSLRPQPTPLAEIIVTPGVYGVLEETVAARRTLTRAEIEASPQIGEDVFHSVARLPGVIGPDLSAAFGVRGSSNSEVLLRLDGIELIEPYHLKDIDAALSIVDLDAIGGVELSTGGFGAQYGDRLAGVFEMRTRDAMPGRPRTTLGLSLTNVRAASTGTFADGRGSWLGTVRRGYLDLALELGGAEDPLSPVYYDLLGKVEYAVNDRLTVSGHVLHAGDRLDYATDNDQPDLVSAYGSSYAWLTVDGILTSRTRSRSMFSLGRVTWDRRGGRERDRFMGGIDVDDVRSYEFAGLRQSVDIDLDEDLMMRAGLELEARSSEYDHDSVIETYVIVDGSRFIDADTTIASLSPGATHTGAWLSARYRPLPALTVEAGARWDRHTHSDDSELGPRLNAAWEIDGRTTVRAAWGRHAQAHGLHELQAGSGETGFSPAERAGHRVVGIERSMNSGLDVRIEAFDRRESNLRPRWVNLDNDADFLPEATSPRARIEPSTAFSRGIEVFARRRAYQGLDWSVMYALSESKQNIDGVDVPGPRDQRHAFGIDGSWASGGGWRLAAAWQFHTGWPRTPATMVVATVDGEIFANREWGAYNTARLPAYHRLDVRVSREILTRRGRLLLMIDVYNLYGRDNARSIIPFISEFRNGRAIVAESISGLLPRLPSFGILWTF
jgi:hypothetical protein